MPDLRRLVGLPSRRAETAFSPAILAVLVVLAGAGLFVIAKELPSLRRYIRLERM